MQIGISPDLTLYKLLTDWGGIIGGGLALVAGLLAYKAGMASVRETRQENAEEAHSLAVSIYSELVELTARIKRAKTSLSKLRDQMATFVGQSVAGSIPLCGGVLIPPLLERNADRLFKLRPRAVASTCSVFFSQLLMYQRFLTAVEEQTTTMVAGEWVVHMEALEKWLDDLERRRNSCQTLLEKHYDVVMTKC